MLKGSEENPIGMVDSGLFVFETFSSENFVPELFASLSRFRLIFLCLNLL